MFTTRPEIAGTFGVVASTHWLASQVGMAVLERGGNAFDAACATAFTLQVAEPHLNGPGGDAPIILHNAQTGTQHVVCGQGVSPQAATLDAFRSLDLDLIPATGLLPAVVPGAFDAWCLLLRDWGTWELADVLAFAIGYARNGVHIVPRISATIEGVRPLFEQRMAELGGGVPAGRQGAAPGLIVRPPRARRDLRTAVPGSGRRHAGGAHRCGAARLVPGFRCRGRRPVLPRHRCAGRVRPPPSRPAARRRFRPLVGDGGGAADLRLSRAHRVEMRTLEPGTGVPAATCIAARVRSRRDGSVRRRFHPHRGGMRQARLRRSRSLLRRSEFRARADRSAVVGRLQCATAAAGRTRRRRSNCGPAAFPAMPRWWITRPPAGRICWRAPPRAPANRPWRGLA